MYQKLSSLQITTLENTRQILNTDTCTTKSAIVSLVTSRLDYCNGLICGITDELLCRLQKVQNNYARVVSGSKKYDQITPRRLRIKALCSCEVIHASIPRKLGGHQAIAVVYLARAAHAISAGIKCLHCSC